jgi:hypothetical protein
MSRLSGHLSQIGALVVAVVAAAVAYSVYDAGSTTSNTDAREPVAGLVADSGDSQLSPESDRQEKEKRVREPNVGRTAGPSGAEAVRSSLPATGPQGQLGELLVQNVSAPPPAASAPVRHASAPLLSRPLHIGVPRAGDDRDRRRGRHHDGGPLRPGPFHPRTLDRELHRLIGGKPLPRVPKGHRDRGPWRPGPFDPRTLDRELHRLVGGKPLPRVPKGPGEHIPRDLPPELINGPGAPAPKSKSAPESPTVPAQSGVPSSPTPAAPSPVSPAPATPAADAPSESTPDEDADSGGAEDDADDTDTGTTTPPPPPAEPAPAPAEPAPAPAEPAPAPADPDDQTGNADDEDAGIDDQSGEAEDESPVPPGGYEGADDGVAGDGDDYSVAPPAPSPPAAVDVEEDSGPSAPAAAALADQVEPQAVDAGLPVTGVS